MSNQQSKLSTVRSVQANGTFESSYGVDLGDGTKGFWKFEYVMEDGAVVNASHKQNSSFKPGDSVEYVITNPTYNNGKVGLPPEQQSKSNNSGSESRQFVADPKKQASIEIQVCLKEANVYHHVHGFATDDPETKRKELCETAAFFFETLFKNSL